MKRDFGIVGVSVSVAKNDEDKRANRNSAWTTLELLGQVEEPFHERAQDISPLLILENGIKQKGSPYRDFSCGFKITKQY